jgi:hypothetical protein
MQCAQVRVLFKHLAERTCNVCVLLQGTELVDRREHVNQLVEPLGKQLKPEEDSTLIHLKGLQEQQGKGVWQLCSEFGLAGRLT